MYKGHIANVGGSPINIEGVFGNNIHPDLLSTVNTLINERQKGKQKMLWTREGAYNVLQIRAAQRSESWNKDSKSVKIWYIN